MIYNFCTIITQSYFHYAMALIESLVGIDDRAFLHILVVDGNGNDGTIPSTTLSNHFAVNNVDEVCSNSVIGKDIYTKYYPRDVDAFRWSMKPVYLNYLLDIHKTAVIYTDCDIHFYSDFTFLFNLLEEHSILLTPHNRTLWPQKDPTNFLQNFYEGIYNAGFIGAATNSKSVLNWWANACLFDCSLNFSKGLFVDQKYLDLLPARFKGVKSLEHQGCNVADWNLLDCERSFKDGKVVINSKYNIVFIHFVSYTIKEILNGRDYLLRPYLQQYNDRLKKYNANCDLIAKYEQLLTKENIIQKKKLSTSLKVLVKNILLRYFKMKVQIEFVKG